MPEGFSWTISGATIFSMAGWLVTVLAFVYRRGIAERSQAASVEHLRRDHDALAREVDQYGVAFNAGLREVRDRMAEHYADTARTYATKQELMALEERTVKGMDRIADRLDQISDRLGQIGDNVVRALLERSAT